MPSAGSGSSSGWGEGEAVSDGRGLGMDYIMSVKYGVKSGHRLTNL
jgi:hypothetical protein